MRLSVSVRLSPGLHRRNCYNNNFKKVTNIKDDVLLKKCSEPSVSRVCLALDKFYSKKYIVYVQDPLQLYEAI